MLTKKQIWNARAVIAIIFLLVLGPIATLVVVMDIYYNEIKTLTNIEAQAMTGVPSENKLGGIQFTARDRWNYNRVVFIVQGFDEGLKLDKVVCRDENGKEYYFNQLSESDKSWITWLKRFQEVLAEVTTGEKNTDLLDPNTIPVS